MLPLNVIEQVHRLLEQGALSQRQIAVQLRVSRGTVHAIARGKRGLYGREAQEAETLPGGHDAAERCRGCGGMVYMPCLLCRARSYQQRKSIEARLNKALARSRRVA